MSTHSLDPFGVDDKSNDLQAKMWNQFLQINMSENPLKNDAEFCVVATREVVKVSAMQYRAASLGIKFKPALFKSKTQIQINKEVPKQIRTATMKINRSNSTLDDLD